MALVLGDSVLSFAQEKEGTKEDGLFKPAHTAEEEAEREIPLPEDAVLAQAKGNTAFSLDLYKTLSSNENGNIFISPLSITEVMAMAYAGASEDTAKAIAQTLHLEGDSDTALKNLSSLNDYLIKSALNADGITLSLNSSLWLQKGTNFLDSFLSALGEAFQSSVFQVDFKEDGEKARTLVNDWASKATSGKIENLLSEPLSDLTRLILLNAVYFKGNWLDAFSPDLSFDGDFNLGTETVTTAYMHRKGRYAYFESDGTQILEIPYTGENISLLAILPKEGEAELKKLEESLSLDLLTAYVEGLTSQQVDVSYPKYTITWGTVPLKNIFSKLGLVVPFSDTADFSGITGDKDLKISEVYHQAFVDVNEEGTEAAAASSVQFVTRSVYAPNPVPVFFANRPFIFFIWEKNTKSALFLGRVVDPRTSPEVVPEKIQKTTTPEKTRENTPEKTSAATIPENSGAPAEGAAK
jgi:serpin B